MMHDDEVWTTYEKDPEDPTPEEISTVEILAAQLKARGLNFFLGLYSPGTERWLIQSTAMAGVMEELVGWMVNKLAALLETDGKSRQH